MQLPKDWPTGVVPYGWINGVPFSFGQPYVVMPDGQIITLTWN